MKTSYLRDLAKLDIERAHRCGIPECILSTDKSPQLVYELLLRMAKLKGFGVATKADEEHIQFIRSKKLSGYVLDYYDKARVLVLKKKNSKFKTIGKKIGILSAGSSDIPIAEEARIIANILGCSVAYDYDVGVAGMHRLINPLKKMIKEKIKCLIVVAGMDGVLPTLVKGLVDLPVIGLPTSRGYGLGGRGKAALTTMLQSCSPGLVVVNIDNGFGAACAAYLIAKQART